MKGDTPYAADHNWLRRGWAQSERDADVSSPDELDEDGRRAVLKDFDLWGSPLAPTLEEIRTMSPTALRALAKQAKTSIECLRNAA